MRTGTNGGIKYAVPDESVWSAERQIIYLERVSGSVSEITLKKRRQGVIPLTDDVLATYTLDSSGKCAIDITGIIRAYGVYQSAIDTNNSLYLTLEYETGSLSWYFLIAGLINPAGVLIPEHEGEPNALIVPPTRLISSEGFSAAVVFEYRERGAGAAASIDEYEGDTIMFTGRVRQPSHALDDTGIDKFIIEMYDADHVEHDYFWYLEPRRCGAQYAMVEWVSFTGATRRHVFEIVKARVETGDVVTLANILNEWTEIKGRVDGFTLRLENLDRYDLWYYSDLITSGSVRVTIDGINWYSVHVDENAYTLPDSNAGRLSTLEIPVKFRKYDAVSL